MGGLTGLGEAAACFIAICIAMIIQIAIPDWSLLSRIVIDLCSIGIGYLIIYIEGRAMYEYRHKDR